MKTFFRVAAILACALLAAPAGAAADTGLTAGPDFPWRTGADEPTEFGLSAVASAGSTGDVFAAGSVTRVYPHPTDPYDRIYVNDAVVRRFSPSGAVLTEHKLPKVTSAPYTVLDIASSPGGDVIYISAAAAPASDPGNRVSLGVLRMDAASGDILGSFAAPGSGPGAVEYVFGLQVAPDGTVYAHGLDDDNHDRIAFFSPAGAYEGHLVPPDQGAVVEDPDYGRSAGGFGLDPRDESLLLRTVVRCGTTLRFRVDRYSAAGAHLGSFALPSGDWLGTLVVRPGDGAIYGLTYAGIRVMDQHGAEIGSLDGEFWGAAFSRDGARLWTRKNLGSTERIAPFTAVAPSAATGAPLPAACPAAGDTGGGGTTTTPAPTGGGAAPVTPIVAPLAPLSLAAEIAKARKVVAKLTTGKLSRKGYTRSFTADRAGAVVEEILVKKKVVARGTATLTAAGTKSLKVKPTKAARKALPPTKSVTVQIRTTFRPTGGGAPVVSAKTVTVKKGR